MDLSPIQPNFVPPNVTFEVDDAESEWLHQLNSFDFIHCRFMFLAIRDFSQLLRQAYTTLKPGGYIQFCEYNIYRKSYDNTLPAYSPALNLVETLGEAAAKMGFDVRIVESLRQMAIDAGYVNVVEQPVEFPCAGWPKDRRLKEAGMFYHAQLRDGLPGIAMALCTRMLGWSPEQVHVTTAEVRKELDDRRIHACGRVTFVYAQKPW
jgi:SAM-dependent methyltransferase